MVQTFSSENISFLIYALIGWGCPALCILVWSIAKVFASHEQDNEHFNGVGTVGLSSQVLIIYLFMNKAGNRMYVDARISH